MMRPSLCAATCGLLFGLLGGIRNRQCGANLASIFWRKVAMAIDKITLSERAQLFNNPQFLIRL